MSSQSNAITVERLVKRYRGKLAVDGISFEVPRGSVFGLLGENGAGKSTTIKALLGLVKPSSGQLSVLDLDPSRKGLDVRRQVGYVPEVPVLYDWMTVASIGWFASGFRANPALFQINFGRLIEGFDLPPSRKVKALSKGMRAKLSLALALAGEPELLILDEPTSGIDVMVRREFLESMVDLAGEGRTVLLSSHQISEVERVASHVALIHQGELVLAEPLDELKARSYVLRFELEPGASLPSPSVTSGLTLVDADEAPRQARWLVHATDREAIAAARYWPGVSGLEIEVPALEEIYIAHMKKRPASGGAGRVALAV